MLSTELLKPLVLVTPGRVYATKMAIRNHSNTFTLDKFPNLFKRPVHIFHDYYVDLNSSNTYINAQGSVSAPL